MLRLRIAILSFASELGNSIWTDIVPPNGLGTSLLSLGNAADPTVPRINEKIEENLTT